MGARKERGYWILHKGQSLDFYFSPPERSAHLRYTIVSTGFFVPEDLILWNAAR
jgi:hypothetical protein